MLLGERARDVRDHRAGRDELVRVDPDAHVAIEVTHHRDLADAGHGLEAIFDLVARDVGEELTRESARDAHGDDRLIVGVRLRDDGRHRAVRHLPLGLSDLRLDVLEREVDVARDVERRGDARAALLRGRRDLLDARDLRDRVLDRVDEPGLDVLGRGAGPGHAHRDRRVVDVGELADADPHHGEDAEEDRPGHDHPGEDGPTEADVGDVNESLRAGDRRSARPPRIRIRRVLRLVRLVQLAGRRHP